MEIPSRTVSLGRLFPISIAKLWNEFIIKMGTVEFDARRIAGKASRSVADLFQSWLCKMGGDLLALYDLGDSYRNRIQATAEANAAQSAESQSQIA